MDIDAFVKTTNRRLDALEQAPRQDADVVTATADASDLRAMCQQFADLVKGVQDHIDGFMQQASAQVIAIEERLVAIEDRLTAPPGDGADSTAVPQPAAEPRGEQAADVTHQPAAELTQSQS